MRYLFIENYIWLIPVLPLIGAVINLLIGSRLNRSMVSILAVGSITLSFILSVIVYVHLISLPPGNRHFIDSVYQWIHVGSFGVGLSFLVDQLSIVMILIVSGVSSVIHLYSVGYMHGDKRFSRYFGFLNLFAFSMLLLVLSNSILLMFVGWEGVGLCSYLLIGFWFEKLENAKAGMKAFVVNRIGDFGFLTGFLLLFTVMGSKTGVWSLDFGVIKSNIMLMPPAVLTAVGLLLFVGATGKSAQIPLYVWLPDAMAGPTPVSALIHAATMVTAGVYMIARMNFLYSLAPDALRVIAIVGALTAFFAATIGLVQNDIKKVLAYSTVSQLGYMFIGVGVGAFASGIFHLMTHAFFKALLFLGSGSVIHAMSGEQDIRKMGGLAKKLPITAATFIVAYLAISGVPGFAGFFSKDDILYNAYISPYGGPFVWTLGVLGAVLTAFYMTRLVILTFFGKPRMDQHTSEHVHESPKTMTIPLIVLAILSVIGGYIGMPEIFGVNNLFAQFLGPVFASGVKLPEGSIGLEWTLMVVSVVMAFTGIGIGYYMYVVNPDMPAALADRFKTVYAWLLNKYYVDEFYFKYVIEPLMYFKGLLLRFDNRVIDGSVNGVARFGKRLSDFEGAFDRIVVDGAVNAVGDGIVSAGSTLRRIQTGFVQSYVMYAIIGLAILLAIVLL
ncbi:MAG: NADH-quinone oxidoreductase subunit L [Deltaproteobacteria bacterium]|nr:NADH-quinone oxidoreductase subunit L [Deltaproteobacteria bacterium]MCL5791579.1 NADH-quinone oxidoreductase subunit L [Deltaproteobacteria bacterium]